MQITPTVRRRLLLAALVAVCAAAVLVAATGCDTLAPNASGWEAKPTHAPLPAYFVDSTAVQIAGACRRPTGTVSGCAVRRYDAGRCYIYVEPNAPAWLATHELAHCAGFDHR